MERFLDCGNLLGGFVRIKCADCGHEYLIKAVPHRHFVFGIPKILRRYFLYDRSLLLELSRCIWESLKIYYQHCHPGKKTIPGAVIAIQTFGDFLGFNPHGHVLVTDGCFPPRKTEAMKNLARYIIRLASGHDHPYPQSRGTNGSMLWFL